MCVELGHTADIPYKARKGAGHLGASSWPGFVVIDKSRSDLGEEAPPVPALSQLDAEQTLHHALGSALCRQEIDGTVEGEAMAEAVTKGEARPRKRLTTGLFTPMLDDRQVNVGVLRADGVMLHRCFVRVLGFYYSRMVVGEVVLRSGQHPGELAGKQSSEGAAGFEGGAQDTPSEDAVVARNGSHDVAVDGVFANLPSQTDDRSHDEVRPSRVVRHPAETGVLASVVGPRRRGETGRRCAATVAVVKAALIAERGLAEWTDLKLGGP